MAIDDIISEHVRLAILMVDYSSQWVPRGGEEQCYYVTSEVINDEALSHHDVYEGKAAIATSVSRTRSSLGYYVLRGRELGVEDSWTVKGIMRGGAGPGTAVPKPSH